MKRHSVSRRRLRRLAPTTFLRVGLAALALPLAYLSVAQSIAYTVGKRAPEKGYAIYPSDGRIGAAFAYKLVTENTDAQRGRAARIARDALAAEPLAASAVVALALHADLRGATGDARKLFAHSEVLTRRNLSSRLWLIEDAVRRNDIESAIRNYDIALRVHPRTFDLLFPILASAIADPTISKTLAVKIGQAPVWRDAFIRYLSTHGPDPKRTATFFSELNASGVPIPEVERAGVVNALAAANAFDQAWAYYKAVRPNAVRQSSRDPEFVEQLKAPTSFDWTPRMSDPGIVASIQRTKDRGVFDFSAPSTVGGIVLEQLQLLPNGRYSISGRTAGIEQIASAAPYWLLMCTDGREIGRVPLPNSSQNSGKFQGNFDIRGNCPAQVLRLIVRPSSLPSGVSGQIERVVLRPL